MTRSRLNVTLYSSPFGSWHRIVTENESFSVSWTGVPAWAAVRFAAASRAVAPESKNFVLLLSRVFDPQHIVTGNAVECRMSSDMRYEKPSGFEPVGTDPGGSCRCWVLVHEPGCVRFPALLHAGVVCSCGHVGHAPERVCGDDRLYDNSKPEGFSNFVLKKLNSLERCDVRYRGREFADRVLCFVALYEICHFFYLLFSPLKEVL